MSCPSVDAIVIADLADAEAALRERLGFVEAERRWFREIAIAAIQVLHRLTKERDTARRSVAAMREQRRSELGRVA